MKPRAAATTRHALGLAALSALLGDHENRDVLAHSSLVTCELKRYAEDRRRIEAIRIVDDVQEEAIEVECSMFSGLPGELVLN